ncbi:transposase [Planctomicrobium sp. SH668]|uniref:transposase n=1 Tax=Planctomicrobium sp. SH668 TaxID=3448126 RepID=UPI003F5C70D6
MAGQLLSDDLWNEIESFFPTYEFSPKGGRPPAENRTVFTCVLFVLKTGIAWEDLPLELGCSYKTCYRRLRQWIDLGVLQDIHRHLLTQLNAAGRLELADVLIDAGLIKSPLGGQKSARIRQTAAAAAASRT